MRKFTIILVTSIILMTIVAPTIAQEDNVVARVNGEGISQEEFDREYLRRAQYFDAQTDSIEALSIQVLDALIEQEIINQAAAELDIIVTEEELDAEIQNLRDSIALGDETWEDWLAANNYSEEELRTAVYDSLITNRIRDYLVGDLLGEVPQLNARHILLRTEEDAIQVLQRIQNGETFEIVAADTSLDTTTRNQGGDLGWFTRDELLDVNLANVVFGLQPGEVAGPIASSIGYHIIQVIEFADRVIEPERMPILMENQFINWLEEQYENAEIERVLEEE